MLTAFPLKFCKDRWISFERIKYSLLPTRARICKHLRSPDFPEIESASLSSLAGRIPWNRFLGSLNVEIFGLCICERYSQTISNLCRAALLRRCELPSISVSAELTRWSLYINHYSHKPCSSLNTVSENQW